MPVAYEIPKNGFDQDNESAYWRDHLPMSMSWRIEMAEKFVARNTHTTEELMLVQLSRMLDAYYAVCYGE